MKGCWRESDREDRETQKGVLDKRTEEGLELCQCTGSVTQTFASFIVKNVFPFGGKSESMQFERQSDTDLLFRKYRLVLFFFI